MAVQSTETCRFIVLYFFPPILEKRENASQNKSNSIINASKRKRVEDELNERVYVCGSPSTVSLLSRCCCPPVKPYNIHNSTGTS